MELKKDTPLITTFKLFFCCNKVYYLHLEVQSSISFLTDKDLLVFPTHITITQLSVA